jgi:hypothetical protein
MGLFKKLGGKKDKELHPEQIGEEIRKAREKELEAVRRAHSDLEWPTIPKINNVNMPGVEACLAETARI